MVVPEEHYGNLDIGGCVPIAWVSRRVQPMLLNDLGWALPDPILVGGSNALEILQMIMLLL